MRSWTVYDEDGDIVEVDVEGVNAATALAQFSYANNAWFAVPSRYRTVEAFTA